MKGLPEDIEHFTARYEVLTKGCRGEMENIVSQLEKAQSSVSQMENHMKVIAKEYNLAKEDWQNVVYSEIELLEAKEVKSPKATHTVYAVKIRFCEENTWGDYVSGYLSVLFEQNPQSVGGALPDDAFYFSR